MAKRVPRILKGARNTFLELTALQQGRCAKSQPADFKTRLKNGLKVLLEL